METKFKKGDYIVTLDIGNTHTFCGKKNYCFKQREDAYYIRPIKDLKGDFSNGNSDLTFDKKRDLKEWRYATEKEVKEYDRLQEPYNVENIVRIFPRVMLVSNFSNMNAAIPRVVFIHKCDKYLAWSDAETFEKAEKIIGTSSWNYAWEIEEKSIFPFSLTAENAKSIIDIACVLWKEKLAKLWATNIILNKNIEVSKDFYEEMYKVCTFEQKELFSNIFK